MLMFYEASEMHAMNVAKESEELVNALKFAASS